MIRSVYFPLSGPVQFDLPLNKIADIFDKKTGKIWISLEQTNPEEINSVLRDICNFHPLSIEDCMGDSFQAPKMDNFGSYLFLVLQAVVNTMPSQATETCELNIFLGEDFLVSSYLGRRMPPVEALWQRLQRNSINVHSGMDTLCHALIDKLVDDYLPTLEWIMDEIELIEDNLLIVPGKETLVKVLDIKHSIIHFRHINFPHRDIMTHLSRDEFPQIAPQNRIYFRDVYDHLVRLQDNLESARDSITSTLEIYLSSTSIRQNEIMKTLTIVSTIFLPLTFLAGVYGMNFHFMPEISWKYGYLFAWILFVVLTIGMLVFFKLRKWL